VSSDDDDYGAGGSDEDVSDDGETIEWCQPSANKCYLLLLLTIDACLLGCCTVDLTQFSVQLMTSLLSRLQSFPPGSVPLIDWISDTRPKNALIRRARILMWSGVLCSINATCRPAWLKVHIAALVTTCIACCFVAATHRKCWTDYNQFNSINLNFLSSESQQTVTRKAAYDFGGVRSKSHVCDDVMKEC